MEGWVKSNLDIDIDLAGECSGYNLDIEGRSFFFGSNGLCNVLEILRKVDIDFPRDSLKSDYEAFCKTAGEFIRQQVVFNKSNHFSHSQMYDSLPSIYRNFFDVMVNDQKLAISGEKYHIFLQVLKI